MELGIPLRIFPPNPLFPKANSVLLQLYFSSFPSPFPFGVLRRSVVGLLGFLLLLPLLCMRAFDGYGGMEEIKKGRNSGEEEEEEEKEATGKTMEDGAGFATKQNSIFETRIHTEVRQFRCDLFGYIGEFLLPPPPPHYSLPAQTLSLFLPLPLSPKPEDLANRKCGGRRKKGKEERKLFSLPSSPFFGSQKRNGRTNGADFFLGFPLFLQMLKEVVAL